MLPEPRQFYLLQRRAEAEMEVFWETCGGYDTEEDEPQVLAHFRHIVATDSSYRLVSVTHGIVETIGGRSGI